MPTSLQSLKDATFKRSSNLKRVLVITSLVVSNVASYVVGNETISVSGIVNLVVKTLAQCVLGGS
jgi:hypothetical protein